MALLTFTQHHRGANFFAELVVWNRKGDHLLNGRVIHQQLVDFQRADFFAATIDDFLEPAGQAQITFFIMGALIAGAEP